jgi:chaperonin cofactor prefoldin
MKMSEEEIAKLFFEFLRHMDKLTDVIESMARKMEEMDKRIEALERKQRRKNENDEG